MEHECSIGVLYDYGDSVIVNLFDLKESIKEESERRKDFLEKYGKEAYECYFHGDKQYSIADYADKRKTTNLARFDYCPVCGKKIDWKSIRND